MTFYSVDKLMEQTRILATEYFRTTGQRLPVSNELSRYDVCQKLGFTPLNNPQKGVDLLGTGKWEGKKVLVKSRVISSSTKSRPRVGQLSFDGNWEIIALVLMNDDYLPESIYVLGRGKLNKNLDIGSSPNNPKGVISVAKFKALGEQVWPEYDP